MGDRELDRDRERQDRDRDWSTEDRDWRTRQYDTRQYTNRNYAMRDYTRDDRYRDKQNADWDTEGWRSTREREWRDPQSPFENNPKDYTHNTGRPNDYGPPAPENPLRTWPGRGRHAGVGPRTWQRSDERILEDVNEELTRDPNVDATEIEVSISGAEITLTGTVSDRHEKRGAEECAWRVGGVKDVHNNIRITKGAAPEKFT